MGRNYGRTEKGTGRTIFFEIRKTLGFFNDFVPYSFDLIHNLSFFVISISHR